MDAALHESSLGWQRTSEETRLDSRASLDAFQELYRLQGARLKSIALNLLGNVDDAEDAVQEVFLRAHRSLGKFRGQAALSTWTYRILLNYCRDVWRKKRYRQEVQPEVHPDVPIDPPVPAGNHPLRMALEASVARLSRKHREVFLLFEVEGFTHAEIGGMLEMSEPASKNLLYEAKQQLRVLLKKKGTKP